ncbi:hypothetical protein GCM10010965_19770 [Caldalkalibacillus thermarum]|nr:hypothetical protein GCM10010965_19770 [Caldalkalibacillus thermarum]
MLNIPHLELDRGEIVAVCGGNGAGKSTLLKMIAGILQPTQGDVIVNGLSRSQVGQPDRKKQYLKQIGYMPDDFQANIPLTVSELLHFYARLLGEPEHKADGLLDLVELSEHKQKKFTQLSKGMRQRFLLAQSLLASPPLLLFDEPTNGLDPLWTRFFAECCLHLQEDGHTVIFSTHDLHIAKEIADRIVFIHKGNIIDDGTVKYFTEQYGTEDLYEIFQTMVLDLEQQK